MNLQVTLLTFGMEDNLQNHEMIQFRIIHLKLPLTSVVVSHILRYLLSESYLNTEYWKSQTNIRQNSASKLIKIKAMWKSCGT